MSFMRWVHNVGGATPIGRWIGLKPAAATSREDTLRLRPLRNPAITWEPKVAEQEEDGRAGRSSHDTTDSGGRAGHAFDDEAEDEVDEKPLTLVLVVPRKSDKLTNAIAKVLQAPDEKRIELDEFGSAIWERCDGTRTIEELARYTSTTYKLNRRQAEVSVMAFMKMLSQRRLVGFLTEGKGVTDVGSSTKAGQRAAKRRGGAKRRF